MTHCNFKHITETQTRIQTPKVQSLTYMAGLTTYLILRIFPKITLLALVAYLRKKKPDILSFFFTCLAKVDTCFRLTPVNNSSSQI